jgi:hypothetical protein
MHGTTPNQHIEIYNFTGGQLCFQVMQVEANEVTDLLAFNVHYPDRFTLPDHTDSSFGCWNENVSFVCHGSFSLPLCIDDVNFQPNRTRKGQKLR